MIVITTPSGQIGQGVLEHMVAARAPTRVIVRHPDRLPDALRKEVEVVTGSHHDLRVLSRALEGAASLFWLVPPDFRAVDARTHYETFTSVLVEALAGRPVRVVTVSSIGRGYPKEAGLLSPAWNMEQAIETTRVPLRTLRLPFFMENILNQVELIRDQGMVAMANSPQRILPSVATRDASRLVAELLLDSSWTDQAGIPFAGDALTPSKMTDTISDVLGRPVRLTPITPAHLEALVAENGASDGWSKGMADMVSAQNDGVYSAEQAGEPLEHRTTFRDWCEQILKPAVV